ncbi:MAG: acyltransferase [Anaerolineales bacterium]
MYQGNPRLKKNNFDLLRLILAGIVCFVHAYQLSGYEALSFIPKILSSEAAVKGFFVASGFLIFMSYERSSSFLSYFSKRIRRIYPAYLIIIITMAFGFVLISDKNASEYFFSVEWVKYLAANLVFLNFIQPSLPGVFESNIFTAANGALWTLKIEVMFYFSVPAIVYLFKYFSKNGVLFSGYILSIVYSTALNTIATQTEKELFQELGRQLPGQLCYFLAGAFLYYNLSQFEKYVIYFIIPSSLVLIVNQFYPIHWIEPFALATIIIFLSLFLYIGEIGKYGDFSYGIYILHSPVLQIFIQYGWFKENPWLYLSAGLLTTFVLAIFLWHGVEKRFLLRNSHYLSNPTRN